MIRLCDLCHPWSGYTKSLPSDFKHGLLWDIIGRLWPDLLAIAVDVINVHLLIVLAIEELLTATTTHELLLALAFHRGLPR